MTSLEKEDQRVAAALRNVGIKVDTVYDLVNSKSSYRSAIPILVEFLPTIGDPRVKEGVVRALAVKEAAGDEAVARALVAEFRAIHVDAEPPLQLLKWVIANTLSVVAGDPVLGEIADLARDARHGKAREMLAEALGNMSAPAAIDVLLELLQDDEVAGHALVALGKLKARRARSAIERFLDHPKPWVRKEAKRALARIQRED